MSKKSRNRRVNQPSINRKATPGKTVPGKVIKGKPSSKGTQWWWVLAAVAILAIALGALWILQPKTGQANNTARREISVAEAYSKYEQDIFLLDVRTQAEWEEYHAPNTTLIPLDQLPDRISELPKDQEIVVICRSGNRSQEGRDILLDAGFTNVSSMAGGLNEWRASGYPTVSGP